LHFNSTTNVLEQAERSSVYNEQSIVTNKHITQQRHMNIIVVYCYSQTYVLNTRESSTTVTERPTAEISTHRRRCAPVQYTSQSTRPTGSPWHNAKALMTLYIDISNVILANNLAAHISHEVAILMSLFFGTSQSRTSTCSFPSSFSTV